MEAVEAAVALVFFGGLVALVVVLVVDGRRSSRRVSEPDLVFALGDDELRVYVFHDGWSEVERVSGGRVVGAWETDASEESEVRDVLADAGARPPELDDWTDQVIRLKPSRRKGQR